jgi:hypothetical protein
MEIEHHLFCILNVFNFKPQNLGEMRGNVAQTNVDEEEGAKGIRGGLAQPKV